MTDSPSVTIQISNFYSDGRQSESTEQVEAPPSMNGEALADWWDNTVFPLTGDGYITDHPYVEGTYVAKVLDAPEALADLIGCTVDWG